MSVKLVMRSRSQHLRSCLHVCIDILRAIDAACTGRKRLSGFLSASEGRVSRVDRVQADRRVCREVVCFWGCRGVVGATRNDGGKWKVTHLDENTYVLIAVAEEKRKGSGRARKLYFSLTACGSSTDLRVFPLQAT